MNTETTRISKFVAALAVTALVSLAACTVETSAGPGSPSESGTPVVESSRPGEPEDPGADGVEPAGSESEEPENGGSQGLAPQRPTREELQVQVTRQLTCEDGGVEIDINGFVTEITEDCDEVLVSGDATRVLAQDIGTLTITGVGVSVYVKELGHVIVTEEAGIPYVIYEGSAPTVDDSAIGSTIIHVDQVN